MLFWCKATKVLLVFRVVNEVIMEFYSSGDQAKMNRFVRSCMDERVVRIMKE